MKYSFKEINFSKHPPLVRIVFEKARYAGLERFFNDDAYLLLEDLEKLAQQETLLPAEFAGNRTLVAFDGEYVSVFDQWEEGAEGYFPPILVEEALFWEVYYSWKEKIEQTHI